MLAGVGIEEARVWPFAQAFLKLKEGILRFPADQVYEAKGNKLLTRRVFQQAAQAPLLPEHDRSIAIEKLRRSLLQEPVAEFEANAFRMARWPFRLVANRLRAIH